MVKVTLGSNTERKQVIVSEDKTVKEIFQENDMDYTTGALMLDGVPVTAAQINMSLKDLNVSESCFLIVTVKSDGAIA